NNSVSYLQLQNILACQQQQAREKLQPVNDAFTQDIFRKLPAVGKVVYQPTEGAPSSITRNIIQDQKGNIWFASFEGMIKYDGEAFTNATEGVSTSRFVLKNCEKTGQLWFGSIGSGVYRYDGTSFTNFTEADGLVDNAITNIYEDQAGRLWFGGGKGISVYDGVTFQNFNQAGQGLCDNDTNDIVEDKNGTYWIGTRGLACLYDGINFQQLKSDTGKLFNNVRHVIRDRHDYMWFGCYNGLWRFDGSTFTLIRERFTGFIFEDRQGNIWTSAESMTANGWALTRFSAATVNDPVPDGEELKTGEGMFFGITETKDGSIWIGTLNGAYRYDGESFTAYSPEVRR
ncbi:MAG: two-component regulator propeller domain-containing protein, partial [Bacteroidota bacterium]